jgi:hypothetical protein
VGVHLQAHHVASAVTTTALIALALLVAMVVPWLTYFPLLLLLLTRFVVRIWERRRVVRS